MKPKPVIKLSTNIFMTQTLRFLMGYIRKRGKSEILRLSPLKYE